MKRSDNRLRTVAALAILKNPANQACLADFAAGPDSEEIRKLAEVFLEDEECTSKMDVLLSQMIASEKFTSLAEIHPAWLLERLKNETPRVIGVILRSLPSKHVRYIVNELPPVLRAQIPNLVESFAVPAPVLKVILERFESHFLPMRSPRSVSNPGFENIYYLKGEELLEVAREAGINELAVAFGRMPNKALHVIYNRLALKDAKRLQKRVRGLQEVSYGFSQSARQNILAVEDGRIGADKMLLDLGIAALGSCLTDQEAGISDLVMQKMEPSLAYLLKRSIDEYRHRSSGSLIEERRASVIKIIVELSDEGKIDSSWKAFFLPDDACIPLKGDISETRMEDETATAQLLA